MRDELEERTLLLGEPFTDEGGVRKDGVEPFGIEGVERDDTPEENGFCEMEPAGTSLDCVGLEGDESDGIRERGEVGAIGEVTGPEGSGFVCDRSVDGEKEDGPGVVRVLLGKTSSGVESGVWRERENSGRGDGLCTLEVPGKGGLSVVAVLGGNVWGVCGGIWESGKELGTVLCPSGTAGLLDSPVVGLPTRELGWGLESEACRGREKSVGEDALWFLDGLGVAGAASVSALVRGL